MAKQPTKTKPDENTDIVAQGQDAELMTFSDDEFFGDGLEDGLEGVSQEDITLPRFTVLQGLSPQVNPRKDEYVEGAKMGMVLNTATGRVYDSINLVMAAYQRRYIEWVPRDKPCPIAGLPKPVGGGLYQDYGTDPSILDECVKFEENNSLWTPRGNELVVTGTWYVVDPETLTTGFMAMGKTQFTASKKLMAGITDERVKTAKGVRPAPLFYRAWEMGTRMRQDGENEWFVWNHKPAFRIQEHVNGRAILDVVRSMQETINAGEAIIDVTVGEPEGAGGGAAGGSSAANNDDVRM